MDIDWCPVCDKKTEGGIYCSAECFHLELDRSRQASLERGKDLNNLSYRVNNTKESSAPLFLDPVASTLGYYTSPRRVGNYQSQYKKPNACPAKEKLQTLGNIKQTILASETADCEQKYPGFHGLYSD
ncbi:hypothetical protein BB560_004198 [Smittium megazygosporum]|uniref:Uncharacterized protein n=1 Tax=Smittium megazygosporum TaxID=133381 RepID=A0A2T9Z9Z3_9FUNG|nr:hypothetical protein BB560_004198 [Smittium megazygosporum]